MKTRIFRMALLTLSVSLMSAMCSSDDDGDSNNNSQEIAQIENEVESGTWRVSSFIDSGQDETNDFTGYNFTFDANGTLTATNGNTTYTGSWSVTDSSNSNDDSSSNDDDDIDFNISFNVSENNDFDDLIDDWDIVSHNSTTISLIDISGGNGGTDTLVFTKN